MASLNAWAEKKKYILLNNLGSKHTLLMKFGQFMSYYERKKIIKKFYKNCNLKTFSNQHVDLLRFIFWEDSLQIKKGL